MRKLFHPSRRRHTFACHDTHGPRDLPIRAAATPFSRVNVSHTNTTTTTTTVGRVRSNYGPSFLLRIRSANVQQCSGIRGRTKRNEVCTTKTTATNKSSPRFSRAVVVALSYTLLSAYGWASALGTTGTFGANRDSFGHMSVLHLRKNGPTLANPNPTESPIYIQHITKLRKNTESKKRTSPANTRRPMQIDLRIIIVDGHLQRRRGERHDSSRELSKPRIIGFGLVVLNKPVQIDRFCNWTG